MRTADELGSHLRNAPRQAVKGAIFRNASPFVWRFAEQTAGTAPGKLIRNVACGCGRNAFYLAQWGCTVICIEKELSSFVANLRLRRNAPAAPSKRLVPEEVDVVKGR